MKDFIEKGDRVSIQFSDGESMPNCEVLYIPCAEGDSWRIKDSKGNLHYIQRFEMMSLLPKDEKFLTHKEG